MKNIHTGNIQLLSQKHTEAVMDYVDYVYVRVDQISYLFERANDHSSSL